MTAERGTRHEILEADATGAVAATYADIRAVTGIPLVNLVWRQLATQPGQLERIWASVRDVVAASSAPLVLLPAARDAVSGRAVGVARSADPRVRATLATFARGNAYNLLALAALLGPPQSAAHGDAPRRASDAPLLTPLTDPILDPARSVSAIDQPAFDELAAAATADGASVAAPSLLRHLASRPGLLAELAAATRPALAPGLGEAARAVATRADLLASTLPAPVTSVDEPLRLGAFSELIARTMVLTALLDRALRARR